MGGPISTFILWGLPESPLIMHGILEPQIEIEEKKKNTVTEEDGETVEKNQLIL